MTQITAISMVYKNEKFNYVAWSADGQCCEWASWALPHGGLGSVPLYVSGHSGLKLHPDLKRTGGPGKFEWGVQKETQEQKGRLVLPLYQYGPGVILCVIQRPDCLRFIVDPVKSTDGHQRLDLSLNVLGANHTYEEWQGKLAKVFPDLTLGLVTIQQMKNLFKTGGKLDNMDAMEVLAQPGLKPEEPPEVCVVGIVFYKTEKSDWQYVVTLSNGKTYKWTPKHEETVLDTVPDKVSKLFGALHPELKRVPGGYKDGKFQWKTPGWVCAQPHEAPSPAIEQPTVFEVMEDMPAQLAEVIKLPPGWHEKSGKEELPTTAAPPRRAKKLGLYGG